MMNLTPDAMLGKTLSDFGVAPALCAELARLRQQVFDTSQSLSGEITLPTPAGTRDFEFTFSPVQDDDGNNRAVLCIGRDVSERKKLEQEREALYRQTARQATELRSVIESIADAVYIGGETGITACNRPALEMLGFGSLEELNQDISILNDRLQNRDAKTGDRIEPEDEPFAHALRGERVIRDVLTHNIKTNQDLVVRCAASPILYEGEIVGAVAINTNVTAQKRAESELGWLAAIVTNSEDAIISKTLDGIITTWNLAAERIFGYTAEEAIGNPKTLLFPPNRLNEEEEILARLRRGERTEHLETQRVRKDGTVIDVLLTISPVKDQQGRIERASIIARDISREKAMQRDLAILNARLQRAMQETHHRVKNNLQILAAMLDISIMETTDVLPIADARRLHQQILLLAKIHDILTKNVDNEAIQAASISVQRVLTELLTMLTQAADRYQLTWEFDNLELPLQQATSLGLVLNELIHNAFKYGRGSIHVSLRVEAATAHLEVVDDGPGLPDGFDHRKNAGTGLTLVDTLVRHDLAGAIEFTTRRDGGTKVTVSVPLSAPSPRPCLL